MTKAYRFIGKDGSCGLQHGRVYIVELQNTSHGLMAVFRAASMAPESVGKQIFWQRIPYSGWESFKNEWQDA